MAELQHRYINNHVFPVVTVNGLGSNTAVYPGEVVEGENYARQIDIRKGLMPYSGPREVGGLRRVGIKSGAQAPQRRDNRDLIPGIMVPRVEGAVATDKIPTSSSQDKYSGKTATEWAHQAEASGLIELSRGQILGLGQFLGLDIPESAAKNEATTCVIEQLKSVAKAEPPKADLAKPASSEKTKR